MRDQYTEIKHLKGNEIYLEWLEKNHGKLDPLNHKLAMNLQSNDKALAFSNEKQRSDIRNVMA